MEKLQNDRNNTWARTKSTQNLSFVKNSPSSKLDLSRFKLKGEEYAGGEKGVQMRRTVLVALAAMGIVVSMGSKAFAQADPYDLSSLLMILRGAFSV